MKKGFVIAIDGPVAAGKGTIAAALAQKIHAMNFNTGGIWRAYTYYLMQRHITPEDNYLHYVKPDMVNIDVRSDGTFEIMLNGEAVTSLLSDPKISKIIPIFGKYRDFTEFIILEMKRIAQKLIVEGDIVIMEGRQIGTDVFPDAEMKIFLTASLDVRSKRRFEQYQVMGIQKTLVDVKLETQLRDEQDMSREFGALVRNPENHGYFILDDTNMSKNETLSVIIGQLGEKKLL